MKAIVTVSGRDTTGIIAAVCTLLSENSVNILDFSQTVMEEFFTMSMLGDTSKSAAGVASLAEKLDELGKKMGLVIHTQREDIFTLMHRV